jgi:hypothetical protein
VGAVLLTVGTTVLGGYGVNAAADKQECETEIDVGLVDTAKCGLGLIELNTMTRRRILDGGGTAAATTAAPVPAGTEAQPPQRPPGECPMNGIIYSPEAQATWETYRPLTGVTENSEPARPQSGLSSADIVYEAVSEGGITRFLGVYYCSPRGFDIGPIRSARQVTYDFSRAYGNRPAYFHQGGAESHIPELHVLQRIENDGTSGANDIDGISSEGFFWADNGRAQEHTRYANSQILGDILSHRGLTNVDASTGVPWNTGFRPYIFEDDAPADQRPAGQIVTIPFWGNDPGQVVTWRYDHASNMYMRENGGVAHVDANTGAQLAAKNVITMFVQEIPEADGVHTHQVTTGTGTALISKNGVTMQATWERPDVTVQPIFKDANGAEVALNRGQIWIEVAGIGTPVTG